MSPFVSCVAKPGFILSFVLPSKVRDFVVEVSEDAVFSDSTITTEKIIPTRICKVMNFIKNNDFFRF